MTKPLIKKAVRQQRKLKCAIVGPSGSGKTWTALTIAKGLSPNNKVLLLDTEQASASLYADEFDFDVIDCQNPSPEKYKMALQAAEENEYDVIILDSLSHAWEALLETHEKETLKDSSRNSFRA